MCLECHCLMGYGRTRLMFNTNKHIALWRQSPEPSDW